MRISLILLLSGILSLGCARMQVGGTDKPIKMDISMRLDIYQHVEKDIDAIENIVSGPKVKKGPADKEGFLELFVSRAYAQESLSPEIEQAALRRKDRLSDLSSWETKGVVGENKDGLVEIRNSQGATPAVNEIVKAENNDRMVIYRAVAAKNGTSVGEVQKLYARRLQDSAPSGTPAQSGDGIWKIK